jgi:hypothetical protein
MTTGAEERRERIRWGTKRRQYLEPCLRSKLKRQEEH